MESFQADRARQGTMNTQARRRLVAGFWGRSVTTHEPNRIRSAAFRLLLASLPSRLLKRPEGHDPKKSSWRQPNEILSFRTIVAYCKSILTDPEPP